MSFWDASIATASTGPPTPPPQTPGQAPPSLNEEVTEVIGQLGRFWGGFRKQGENAIQAARKDLGDYVSQAQQGLNKQLATLSPSSTAPASSGTDAHLPDTSSSHDLTDVAATDGEGSTSSSTSASTASLLEPQQQQQQQERLAAQTSTAQHQTLFTRLQSSFSPDFVTSLRDTIPDSVRQAQGRMDLAQQAAQARMQDAATRGEELLRGASIFLRDAVRVVPPEQANTSSSTPTSAPTPPAHEGTATPRVEASTSAVTATSPPATRRDALLHSLRANPAILRVDPAGEERSANLFLSWTKAGADAARDETQRQAELVADDGVLANTRSVLVPEVLTENDFWIRYFFRIYQIKQDDERRKAVLEGATEQEDDFSWEDEDEDTAPKGEPLSSAPPVPPILNHDQVPATIMHGATSPQRSEDSFDFVSSAHTSVTGDAASAAHARTKEGSGDDNGDDEGEEGKEDGEDGDEDEDESDWE